MSQVYLMVGNSNLNKGIKVLQCVCFMESKVKM